MSTRTILKKGEDFTYDLRSNFDVEEKKKLKIQGCTKIGLPPSVQRKKTEISVPKERLVTNTETRKLMRWETPEILIPKIPMSI